jgi:AcrR family transcriptional regulator
MPRPLAAGVQQATGGDSAAVRGHILDAAHRVIAEQGLAAASTRAIATEAQIGAGTLYNYFDDRLDLVALAILHHAHRLAQPIAAFPARAGKGTVRANLRRFATLVDAVLVEVVPLIAAAFADTALLERLRVAMHEDDPATIGARVVTEYLQAERELGRVRSDADCEAAASVVVSLCHDLAFQRYLHGHTGRRPVPNRELDLVTAALI